MSQSTQISADAESESDGGHDALELAGVLGIAEGAHCEVGTCLLYRPVSVHRAIGDGVDVELEPLFSEAREKLEDASAPTHVVGARSPGRMLIECAERIGAGTRKTSERVMLGSVTKRLIRTAPCPVLVVPHV